MRRAVILCLLSLLVVLTLTTPVLAGDKGKGAYRGEAADPLYWQLGTIKYLSNPSGYHFWFTAVGNLGIYEKGHSYHNVYKLADKVDDPGEWAGPGKVPEAGTGRPPYNLVGHEGKSVYWRIYDTTTGTQIVP